MDPLDAGPGGSSAGPAVPTSNHGATPPRGLQRVPRSSIDRGRYGRMFRHLRPHTPGDDDLLRLAHSMDPPMPVPGEPPPPPGSVQQGENPEIPAGYVYIGQFVDHDITFDPTSVLQRRNDPDALANYRTPRFDLDSMYGAGPSDQPFLYDQRDPSKLLVGRNRRRDEERHDLPRNDQGRAIIGDPRNDVHVIISQLSLAFIRFHNAVVDHLRDRMVPEADLFAEAQRLTRWHYQWVVVEDYLRRMVGGEVLRRVLVEEPDGRLRADLRWFTWKREPFMPVEFSVAAFRFGHSQIRARYVLNRELPPKHILVPGHQPDPMEHLGGFRPLPKGWKVSWDLFFAIGDSRPQLSRRIDTKMTGSLQTLPPSFDREGRSLAFLDLLRGKALGLPSGEAVAAAMGTSRHDLGLEGETPLWYYVLREAEVDSGGVRLGPTGATIVAEVLVGLLAADPSSYLRVAPAWKPELPAAEPGDFTMVDLLRFAGVG